MMNWGPHVGKCLRAKKRWTGNLCEKKEGSVTRIVAISTRGGRTCTPRLEAMSCTVEFPNIYFLPALRINFRILGNLCVSLALQAFDLFHQTCDISMRQAALIKLIETPFAL